MLKMPRFDRHYCLYKTQYPVTHHLRCCEREHFNGDYWDERERGKEQRDVEDVPGDHHDLADNDSVDHQGNPYSSNSLLFIFVSSGQTIS